MEPYVVICLLASGILCALIAHRKRRKVETWFLLGLFFSVFALVSITLLPRKPDLSWRCPVCGAMNREMAFFCYSCNTERTDIPL